MVLKKNNFVDRVIRKILEIKAFRNRNEILDLGFSKYFQRFENVFKNNNRAFAVTIIEAKNRKLQMATPTSKLHRRKPINGIETLLTAPKNGDKRQSKAVCAEKEVS